MYLLHNQQHICICAVLCSKSSDSQPRGSDDPSRQQSYSTITTAQLAAALASATGEIARQNNYCVNVMCYCIFLLRCYVKMNKYRCSWFRIHVIPLFRLRHLYRKCDLCTPKIWYVHYTHMLLLTIMEVWSITVTRIVFCTTPSHWLQYNFSSCSVIWRECHHTRDVQPSSAASHCQHRKTPCFR
jgi:hypothetical protein